MKRTVLIEHEYNCIGDTRECTLTGAWKITVQEGVDYLFVEISYTVKEYEPVVWVEDVSYRKANIFLKFLGMKLYTTAAPSVYKEVTKTKWVNSDRIKITVVDEYPVHRCGE